MLNEVIRRPQPQRFSIGIPGLRRLYQLWTEQEEQQIIDLRSRGLTPKKIHEILDLRTPAAIIHKFRRLDHSNQRGVCQKANDRPTPEDVQEMINLRQNERLSYTQIAERLQTSSKDTVRNTLAALRETPSGEPLRFKGLVPPRRAWTPEELERMAELRRQGFSSSQIAESLRARTLQAIRTMLSREQVSDPSETKIRFYAPSEDETIVRMKSLGHSWKTIAEALPGRTAKGVQKRYHLNLMAGRECDSNNPTFRHWSEDEVRQLRHLREELCLPWKQVHARLASKWSLAALKYKMHTLRIADKMHSSQKPDEKAREGKWR